MSPTVTEKKKYSYKDYLKTPEDERCELIEGELIKIPTPSIRHQRISGKLSFDLNKVITQNNLGELFHAPLDVYLDDKNVVQPDIMFISKNRLNIIGEKNIQGAPDLMIEIISESTAYRDFVQKKRLYARFGIREYWIVIPEEESIEIYLLKDNIYTPHKAYNKKDTLESLSLKDLKIALKSIF